MSLRLLLLIIIFPLASFGQLTISCGGINKYIPNFTKGVAGSSGSLLSKYRIVSPISLSKAEFEMRYILFREGHEITLIIKCTGNNMEADSYDIFLGPNNKMATDNGRYQNIGMVQGDSTTFVLFDSKKNIAPPGNYSWESFFSVLINNHLFDMPDESVLDKMAQEDNPRSKYALRDCCGQFCELKIGSHFRNFSILGWYGTTKRTAKLLAYRENLIKTILPLLN